MILFFSLGFFMLSSIDIQSTDFLHVSSFTGAWILINRVFNKVNLASFKTENFLSLLKIKYSNFRSSTMNLFSLLIFFIDNIFSSLLLVLFPVLGMEMKRTASIINDYIFQLSPPSYKSSPTKFDVQSKFFLYSCMHTYLIISQPYLFPPNLCILNL